MKTIVHCSGYSLAQDPFSIGVLDQNGKVKPIGPYGDWEHVCWGNPKRAALGRIPMTVWLARQVKADQVIWSTGCTKTALGEWEAEVMYNRAYEYDRLLRDFPHRFPDGFLPGKRSYRSWLNQLSIFDIESTTTATSMAWIQSHLQILQIVREPAMLYLVSSANHALRVLRDAMSALNYDEDNQITPMAVPAETSYGRKSVQDTVVRDLGD